MNTNEEQRRADLRGDISFQVHFKILTQAEYEANKNSIHYTPCYNHKLLQMEASGIDSKIDSGIPNPQMAEYLSRIEEKLDLILAILSEKEQNKEIFEQGTGINISGSGMRMMVDRSPDQPVEVGQILYTDFVLSKLPYIRINLFGKVLRVTLLKKDQGITCDLGIQFLDPDERIREQIFSKIFQLQRKAIRNSKQTY